VESQCRTVLELRMRLIPYLHAAFVRYHREGLPPFRALVMDYPEDPGTFAVDDQYLAGESLLVAPVFAGVCALGLSAAGRLVRFLDRAEARWQAAPRNPGAA